MDDFVVWGQQDMVSDMVIWCLRLNHHRYGGYGVDMENRASNQAKYGV